MPTEPTRNYELTHVAGMQIRDDEIIDDMKRVAAERGEGRLPARVYEQHGKYSHTTASKRFGSWNGALEAAGLPTLNRTDITDVELFCNVQGLWIHLGRQPRKRELVPPLSSFSERPYASRFGSWRKALEQFIEWINVESHADDAPSTGNSDRPRRTPRDPNLALRFKVMRRDAFKCCVCGRSPANDRSVELHIDHVKPWSQGGETIEENLQTLCSQCNLGKGVSLMTLGQD